MERKNFVKLLAGGSGAIISVPPADLRFFIKKYPEPEEGSSDFGADLIIAGDGLGGCAAALSALRNNLKVIMTEETDWLDGQVS